MENPDWLETPAPKTTSTDTELNLAPAISRRAATLARNDIIFNNMLEDALDRIANGHPLSAIVDDDPRGIEYGKFYAWLLRDPERKARYYEAREIGAEMVADELMTISDATNNSMEDVARSKLRVDTRKFLLGVWNRKRYGDDKTIISPVGGGGITINFGTVTSPYTIDNTPDMKTITDV